MNEYIYIRKRGGFLDPFPTFFFIYRLQVGDMSFTIDATPVQIRACHYMFIHWHEFVHTYTI